ncbi:MAG TPA: condensation domain-containing protein [Ktedonobacteraceae bacterium]|nr:condensation domain-containing protein [Ktedonobacteraceae bacterium]
MFTKEEREKRLSTFSASKQALLEKRLQGIAGSNQAPSLIPKRPPQEAALASFSQQRLWFLQELEPETTAYNEVKAVRISFQLDSDLLRRALLEVMRRHEILRTNFVLVREQVQQVISPCEEALSRLIFYEFDLQESSEQEQQAALDSIHAFAQQPFTLAHDMLWRSMLVRLSPEDSILVIVIHHILCDGWGLDILEREIKTLYEAFHLGKLSPLPELAIQYADFAYWQHQYMKEKLLEQQLPYWQEVLANPPEQPLLMGDGNLSQIEQRSTGARLAFTVPPATTQQLKMLSSQEGTTLFMTLLAAFQVLLYHYSDQTDILVGSPIANRARPEFELLIGCFINTLILRTDLAGDPTIHELLQRVRATALGAYAHQDVPFEKLVEELSPRRDLQRNPFFQVLFTFQNYQQHSTNSSPSSSDMTDWQVDATSAKFDLDLMMWESADALKGYFSYHRGRFASATIEQMQQHFMTVLEEMATNPTKSLLDMPTPIEGKRQVASPGQEPEINDTPALRDEADTPLEEILALLWAEILEKEQISVSTNFFEAGGYSLQATRLLARIQDTLGIEIPLRLIFDAPTVASFVEALMKDEQQRALIERNIELMLSVAQLSEDEVTTLLQDAD